MLKDLMILECILSFEILKYIKFLLKINDLVLIKNNREFRL